MTSNLIMVAVTLLCTLFGLVQIQAACKARRKAVIRFLLSAYCIWPHCEGLALCSTCCYFFQTHRIIEHLSWKGLIRIIKSRIYTNHPKIKPYVWALPGSFSNFCKFCASPLHWGACSLPDHLLMKNIKGFLEFFQWQWSGVSKQYKCSG